MIFSFISVPFNVIAQPNDSIKLSQETAIKLQEDINSLNIYLQRLSLLNDSLKQFNEQLIANNYQLNNKLKAEQFEGKLFESVLNEQTYRFLFLTLVLVILGTAISIYALRDKGKQLEQRFTGAIGEINKTYSKNLLRQLSVERELYDSLGKVNYNIAKQYATDGKFILALSYILSSGMYIYKTTLDQEGRIIESASATIIRLMSILTTADHYIDSIPKTDKSIEEFRSLFPDMLIALDQMTQSSDSSINMRASEIKRKLVDLEQL